MKDFAEANGINLTFEDNKREARMDAEEEQFVMTKVSFTFYCWIHFNFL